MHMHDTLARTGWIGLFAPQDLLFTHFLILNVHVGYSWAVEAFLQIISDDMTEADQMIWDLSGGFAQQQYCGLNCSNLKQVHLLLWFGLFHSGLIHWLPHHHSSKIRPWL